MDEIKPVIGNDAIKMPTQTPKPPKKVHMKFTFQPMVGGIRKTVYKYGVTGLEELFQKFSEVIPEGYAIAFNIKVFPMEQDSHLRQMLEKGHRVSETKFNVNKKMEDKMGLLSDGEK